MSDYMFDSDAHNMHSLDYEESIRGEELHVNDKAIRNKKLYIDDKSPRDKELSQNKEFLKKEKTNQKKYNCQYAHNSSIGNMLGHFWSKYRIDKEYSNRANTEYIGVMATCADSTFVLKEVLLMTQPLPSPYIAKNIKDSFNQIINEWDLIGRLGSDLKNCKKQLIILSLYYCLNLNDVTILMKNIDEQTKDDYADLLFEPREQINNNQSQLIINEEDSDEFDNELSIISEKLQQLFHPPVDTEGLYNLVKAASYLSLQKFAESSSMSASNPAITNDLVLDLYNNEKSDNAYKENK
ncbi:21633_t:CDS:2, partial [Gigaspora margarita]